MHWSYRIFTVFGIDVRVHATFLFIVAYFAFVWGAMREPGGWIGALYGVLLVVLLFALVLIHELSHSRVAQHYGIEVKNITLLPIGGVSSMEEIPQDPRRELIISVVGPLSNVVLGLLMLAAAPLFFDVGRVFSAGEFSNLLLSRGFVAAYVYLFVVNLTLAVFNLLPAFPMDGGRVFRAFLAMRMGRPRATRIAVVVGQILAVAMGVAGLLGGGVFLMFVAVFIYFGAQAEGAGNDIQRVLGDLRVRQAVNTRIETASPGQTIGELAARLFHIYQEDFAVVDSAGQVVGVLTRDRLISMLGKHGSDFPVSEAMRTEFPICRLDDSVYDAFTRMRTQQFKAAPVIEGGRFIGMVSLEDISEVYTLLQVGGPALAAQVSDEPR
jgi:Zn-dependent protease